MAKKEVNVVERIKEVAQDVYNKIKLVKNPELEKLKGAAA